MRYLSVHGRRGGREQALRRLRRWVRRALRRLCLSPLHLRLRSESRCLSSARRSIIDSLAQGFMLQQLLRFSP